MLQWSCNFIVTEIQRGAIRFTLVFGGFNGAVTLSLQKSDIGSQVRKVPIGLQWSCNFIVTEIAPTSGNPYRDSMSRFNGAVTLSLQKFVHVITHVFNISISFNGAVTLSLQKSGSASALWTQLL